MRKHMGEKPRWVELGEYRKLQLGMDRKGQARTRWEEVNKEPNSPLFTGLLSEKVKDVWKRWCQHHTEGNNHGVEAPDRTREKSICSVWRRNFLESPSGLSSRLSDQQHAHFLFPTGWNRQLAGITKASLWSGKIHTGSISPADLSSQKHPP